MDQVFPYANIVAGLLMLIVGFVFHWIAQLVSVLDWDRATKIGLQEEALPPGYKVYEQAMAQADVALGWIYGIAGIGLLVDAQLGYTLAWFPGVVLVYHSLSVWVWTGNQRKAGHKLLGDSFRIGWTVANFVAGALAILVAWNAC